MSFIPPANILAAYTASVGRVIRRVEIFEADGRTPWAGVQFGEDHIISGSVNIDYDRAERRTFNLTVDNSDGVFTSAVKSTPIWYDKIIKIYRGLQLDNGTNWRIQLGEFMIDEISMDNAPGFINLTGKDSTKKCLLDKFETTVQFNANIYTAETLIKTLAMRAGIPANKIALSGSVHNFVNNYVFDADKSMWECMKQVAIDSQLEIFFDNYGVLQVRSFNDPTTNPPLFTFKTGRTKDATLISHSHRMSDASIYNSITVRGESSNAATPPVYAIAQNTSPTSPTSIARLGRRSTTYVSPNVTTPEQAQAVANNMLAISGLEEFELGWESLCLDWLDVGEVVEVLTERSMPGLPTRYLLSSLTIPLELGSMSANGKRMTIAA